MVNPDGRLAGTPTTPGVYQLDIVATDASGSGPQTLGTLQLTINPALELADVFGVVANRVVAADIGKGGTTAVWTPGTQPPAGFALAGGDTLRLTSGNSGPAGSFDVTATATDSIGASLPTTTSHVVVSDPVSAARRAQVAADQRIGFWFDAVEGSRASFDFSFTGGAKAPVLATVVDAAGTKLDFASAYRRDGGHIRITNLLVPKTARYFIVFKASSTASTVTDARRNVRAPSLYTGVVNIEDAAAKADTKFHAIAGGRAKFVLRAAHAPFPATPGSIQLFGPAGAEIPLPPARAGDGGDRLTISGVRMPVSGEYTLRVGGDGQTIGPLVFEISISTPRNAAFSID
jgi:hypothetical protein